MKSGSASWPAPLPGHSSHSLLCGPCCKAWAPRLEWKSSPSSSNSSAFRDPVPSSGLFSKGAEGSGGERNIYRLPLVCAPTGYQTCNLRARPGIKPATFQGTGWHRHRATGRPAAFPTFTMAPADAVALAGLCLQRICGSGSNWCVAHWPRGAVCVPPRLRSDAPRKRACPRRAGVPGLGREGHTGYFVSF